MKENTSGERWLTSIAVHLFCFMRNASKWKTSSTSVSKDTTTPPLNNETVCLLCALAVQVWSLIPTQVFYSDLATQGSAHQNQHPEEPTLKSKTTVLIILKYMKRSTCSLMRTKYCFNSDLCPSALGQNTWTNSVLNCAVPNKAGSASVSSLGKQH